MHNSVICEKIHESALLDVWQLASVIRPCCFSMFNCVFEHVYVKDMFVLSAAC